MRTDSAQPAPPPSPSSSCDREPAIDGSGEGAAPSGQVEVLGPAVVVSPRPLRARIEGGAADGREVAVELAVTFPFQPAAGDRLLVVGKGAAFYAIGVLAAAAQPTLSFRGDVDLRAVGGALHLRGDAGLELEAPQITLRAELLRLFADSLTERADTAFRWVKGLLTVQAGESRRTVQGLDHSQCEESVTLAQGTVKLDGHKVLLGH